MENEKKPSRLGVRLSAIVVVVLLVVCMAVPAFAATVEPDEYNKLPFAIDLPDGYDHYALALESDGETFIAFAFSGTKDGFPKIVASGARYAFKCGQSFMFMTFSLTGDAVTQWKSTSDSYSYFVSAKSKDWYSNVVIYKEDGSVLYTPTLPPPPDPLDSVGSGLTIVLDWVGATVSALFSGSLSGLLPLVAVPVAITLLLVAIIVIKRSIWGA